MGGCRTMKTNFPNGLLVLSFLFSGTTFGQGFSKFSFTNFEPVDALIFDAEGVPLGLDFLVELWGSATSDSLVPALDFSTGNRVIVPFLGNGQEGLFVSSKEMIVSAEFFDGGYSWLQVRAWDGRLGSTYEEVAALDIGGYGESAVFYADGSSPFAEPPALPAPLIGLESFSLRPIAMRSSLSSPHGHRLTGVMQSHEKRSSL